MTKEFYDYISAQIIAQVPEITYVRLYNNQFERLDDGGTYAFPFPCAFIEFINNENIKQLGNGIQLYEPLIVRIHIGEIEYDNGNGQLDDNTSIYTLKEKVYKALNKFECNKASTFIRIDERPNYDHDQVYVYTMDFKTTLVDVSRVEPVDGVTTEPPTILDLTVQFE